MVAPRQTSLACLRCLLRATSLRRGQGRLATEDPLVDLTVDRRDTTDAKLCLCIAARGDSEGNGEYRLHFDIVSCQTKAKGRVIGV